MLISFLFWDTSKTWNVTSRRSYFLRLRTSPISLLFHFVTSPVSRTCPIAVTIFTNYIWSGITKVTSLNLGHRLGNKRVGIADDAAESENDLRRQLFQFCQARHQLDANVSSSKTKFVTIAKEPPRRELVVEDKPTEHVMQFRCQGVDISSAQDPAKDLRSQSNKESALSTRYRLVKPLCARREQIRIYNSCIG